MIYHDQTFETLAVAPVKRSNVIVAQQNQDPYGFFDAGVKWSSGDSLMSVSIDAVGSFLGTTTKKATVKLLGIIDTSKAGDLFQIRLGLYNKDPSVNGYNYISQGFYIVDNVAYDYQAGSTTVVMYDHMWSASQTPYTGSFSFPSTVAQLASKVASALGVSLMPGFSSLPNASFSIPNDLYANISNATYQTIIQELAASTGTTARMSDATLTFTKFSDVPEVMGINLITNGDFEINTAGWSSFSGATIAKSATHAYTGLNSLSVTTGGTSGRGASYNNVSVLPNTTYVINAYVYAPVATDIELVVDYFNDAVYVGGSYSTHLTGNAGWQLIQRTFTTSNTTDLVNFTLKTTSNTTFYIDNAQMLRGIENLTSNQLKTLTIGDQYGPVTSVVLGRVPQNDNIVLTNANPTVTTISSIDPATDLITINANGMTNGTLIQISSTGTLPVPLQPDTNYFVYTNGSANTFRLTSTYADAIAGTNLIDLTSAGTGTISLTELSTEEAQINNVQILDNDRQTLLPPLYAALLGTSWNEVKADTVGLGWHEVGDVIQFTQGSIVVKSFLSEVHITLAGSIKESLVSVIPHAETVNYQTAGGILRTLWDTEIKVDKQNNDIESLVSQQQVYADQTLESFTEVYQAIDNVTTTVQSVGGGNMILNSVGYARENNGSLSFWTQSGTGTVTSYSSAASLAAGASSGSVIDLVGSSAQIVQTVQVATSAAYSVGFRVNKALGDGSARLYLTNDVTSYYIDIPLNTKYVWQELKLENIVPQQNFWNVELVITGTTTKIEVTDLRLLLGPTLSQWTQSQSEILNTQVALTTEGIKVSSSVYAGDYTVMTPLEFAGYSSISGGNKKIFSVNRDTTEVTKLLVEDAADFGGVIRMVTITSGPKAGIAFVGSIS